MDGETVEGEGEGEGGTNTSSGGASEGSTSFKIAEFQFRDSCPMQVQCVVHNGYGTDIATVSLCSEGVCVWVGVCVV